MKTFQEFILESPGQRSDYNGPGQGELLGKMSTDDHLKCMNYHANEGNKIQAGKAKYSSSYTPEDKKKQLVRHRDMYIKHQEAIQRIGDVGNHSKD